MADTNKQYKISASTIVLTEKKFFLPILINDGGNDIECELNKHAERIKNVKFHVESDDYFGTIATVVDLMAQLNQNLNEKQRRILFGLKEDLLYLQNKYKIVKK